MSMEKLIKEVTECVEREYGRAGAKFGLINHSDHESYAIILEEFQEAMSDADTFESQLESFWELTKNDAPGNEKYEILEAMQARAIFGACELIQVAAMAKKSAITVCSREVVTELREERGGT